MEPLNAISDRQLCTKWIEIYFNFWIWSAPMSMLKINLRLGKGLFSVDTADPAQ